jgi:hypothetical protein
MERKGKESGEEEEAHVRVVGRSSTQSRRSPFD